MQDVLFDGWAGIGRTLIAAPLIYVAIIAMIRISGKRSTAQMNNFDWIVTVAMGSLVASCLVTENVTLAEALVAIAALLALQFAATALAWRSDLAVKLIKSRPRLLFDRDFLEDAMRDERVTRQEILAAMRESGFVRRDTVRWVILETDGSFSVIANPDDPEKADTLENVPAPGAV